MRNFNCRVRRSVNPTNHVKRGVRQVLFLYNLPSNDKILNLSVRDNYMVFNQESKC